MLYCFVLRARLFVLLVNPAGIDVLPVGLGAGFRGRAAPVEGRRVPPVSAHSDVAVRRESSRLSYTSTTDYCL